MKQGFYSVNGGDRCRTALCEKSGILIEKGFAKTKVDATKIRYIHLILLRWLSALHLLAEKAGDRLRELTLGVSGGGAAARGG